MASGTQNAYRLLPAVDQVLRDPAVAVLEERVGARLLTDLVGEVLDAWRAEIRAGALDSSALEARLAEGALAAHVVRLVAEEEGRGVMPVVNATGVVMHTGLGRSSVHAEAAAAMRAAAGGYCVLEVDRYSGERNQRDDRLSVLCQRLLGCEAAIAVNNNAAAAFLTMHAFAKGREAIVSRGELVEIGGSFRVPAVMEAAGVKLVEVGATNRTRAADYAAAITEHTGLLMKVHTSNFRLVGFTEEVPMEELAALGQEHGIVTGFDLGSGRIEAEGARPLDMLGGETLVREAVESGIDVVSFSGDKLLGGPQAGILVGHAQAIGVLRKNPIYRAMRLDKVTLAGLEKTLELLLAGRGDELPVRRMLLATPAELEPRARELAARLDAIEQLSAAAEPGQSQPGSGSAPGVFLDSWVVRITHAALTPGRLAARLRAGDPPVFARVHDDALLCDPRTLLEGDEDRLVEAFTGLSA